MAISRWSDKDSPFQYVFGIWKQVGLTIQSLLFSCACLCLWFFAFWLPGRTFPLQDIEFLLPFTVALSSLALILVGGFTLTKVLEKMDRIVTAIMWPDPDTGRKMFLRERDERMLWSMKVFLGTCIIIVIAHAFVLPWTTAWTGTGAVFVTSLICSKFWVLIMHYDNPVRGSKWIRERVRKEWLEADIDEVFFPHLLPDTRETNMARVA